MKHTQLFCTAALLCVFALKAGGQSSASLSGTVTDPTGAVVVNAHVTVRSLATGVDRGIETDSAGLFAVPSLQSGEYRVQITASGFGFYTVPKVSLKVASQPSSNVQSSTFGQISSTRFATSDGGSSRQLQISAKFAFKLPMVLSGARSSGRDLFSTAMLQSWLKFSRGSYNVGNRTQQKDSKHDDTPGSERLFC